MPRLLALLYLICFTLLLASCNNAPNATPTANPTAAPTPTDALIVKRLDPLHQSKQNFEITITDKQTIDDIYDNLTHLPPASTEIMFCPADNGVQYELTFIEDAKTKATATVNAMGCRGVTMNGQSYSGLGPEGADFRSTLEQALGLTDSEFIVGFAAQ
jgi:hypothetical protein